MSAPEQDSGSVEYGMTMPFVAVTSRGGPYEDLSYTAGWEMGALNTLLGMERPHPHTHSQTIHAANQRQADLIAMHHGYAAAFSDTTDGWMVASFTRPAPEVEQG